MLKSWTLLTQRVGDLPIQIYLMNPIPSIMIPHIRSHPKVWDMTGRPTSRTLWRRRSMGSWPALLASGRRCRRPWTMDRRTVGRLKYVDYIIYLFSYIYVRYISHISRLPLGIINRYAFSWEDQTLEKALENAKKGISDFDEKMEPITGKKRKADKSANSGTSKKK